MGNAHAVSESACPLSRACCSLMQVVTRMGLFGLGVPEIAVIAGVAVLIFGAGGTPDSRAASTCIILE